MAADHVEYHIHTPAAGHGAHHVDEILAAIVDAALGAERLAGPRLVIAAGGREDAIAAGREMADYLPKLFARRRRDRNLSRRKDAVSRLLATKFVQSE